MDRFIVGTGRCGSTLLSQMLAEHPAVLSLFELFNGIDAARRFAPEPISGEELRRADRGRAAAVTADVRRGYGWPRSSIRSRRAVTGAAIRCRGSSWRCCRGSPPTRTRCSAR
jgi:hypothetical protein